MDESKSETHLKRGASRPLAVPTIIDVIRNRAEQEPHHTALLFLEDGEHTVRCWSYQELWTRVRDVAERVQSLRGERVVLLYDAGLEYIAAFLGVLAAGAVAVPSYPPAGRRAELGPDGLALDGELQRAPFRIAGGGPEGVGLADRGHGRRRAGDRWGTVAGLGQSRANERKAKQCRQQFPLHESPLEPPCE